MFTQEFLRSSVARRIADVRAGFPGVRHTNAGSPGTGRAGDGRDPTVQAGSQDWADLVGQAPDTTVIVVLRRFDPAAFISSALGFAGHLTGDLRESWCQAYTRTVFLAGNPANLRDRFDFAQVCDDGSMAWTAPAPGSGQSALRRLLRTFPASSLPALPALITAGADGRGELPAAEAARLDAARLEVATAGVSTVDYLVHVHHVLAEAVLTGQLEPGREVTVRHVPRIDGPDARYALLRVAADTARPDRLRAYAGLRTHPGSV